LTKQKRFQVHVRSSKAVLRSFLEDSLVISIKSITFAAAKVAGEESDSDRRRAFCNKVVSIETKIVTK
jgi:hypothetical protein